MTDVCPGSRRDCEITLPARKKVRCLVCNRRLRPCGVYHDEPGAHATEPEKAEIPDHKSKGAKR